MDAGPPRPRLQTYPGFNDPQQLEQLNQQQRSKSKDTAAAAAANNPENGNGNNGVAGAAGNESPESGSLYSDEIPSGYNSGEQYDTISTGYMSGEAYELPETRLELREPSLDVIEECIQPLGSAVSEENIFRVPTITVGTPVHMTNANNTIISIEQDEAPSSTSSGAEDNGDQDNKMGLGGATGNSPMVNYGKKLLRKKATFSVPIESSPLSKADAVEGYDESSDPGMGDAPTGGYRAVPSDTDTSAFDSDPNAHLTDGRHKRLGRKARKHLKNHDETWFNSHDTKTWSRIRFCCFWLSVFSMIIACVVSGVLIGLMPRNCDPELEWYQGKVILDVFPGKSPDLSLIQANVEKYQKLGISGLHLKSRAPIPTSKHIQIINDNLGSNDSIKSFINYLHTNNLSVMIQIPIERDNLIIDGDKSLDMDMEHHVDAAIRFWMILGADGVFLDGLERFKADNWIARKISSWNGLLDRFGGETNRSHILMTSYKFAQGLTGNPDIPDDVAQEALAHLDLLDAHLDLDKNITDMEMEMQNITNWDNIDSRPWINWNLQGSLPLSNAAIALHMLLPGTINLNGANLNYSNDSTTSHNISNMTSLRALAVPIHMNGNYRKCHCETGTTKEINYVISQPINETIQLERYYSRRHRYVLVANFGQDPVNLDPVGKIYSGGELVLDTSQSLPKNDGKEEEEEIGKNKEEKEDEVTKFSTINLQPGEAIVIKLPK